MTSETSSGIEEWQQRPPFIKAQNGKEPGMVYWTGKCHCGRVAYQINKEKPLDAKYCHCTGCQVLHGWSRVSSLSPYLVARPIYLVNPTTKFYIY
ncbi:hypothetical protein I7I50_05817 [Histoplasma capsulatum G186AR]|uniref:CENP-V/GFA domain-containing protein n=1 Tax=Ajellomyces capsulatus TaxID=5037 RepID=A0A8H7ZAY1_AJECA|nr:hypothetical protein I7I52_04076 [Histoplasma capsulatum]QSS76385.1 hypothetical protein I7I50_05817 [Histoplasma capsulatum G186AR]